MSRNRPEPKAGDGAPGGEGGDMMDPFSNMDESQLESAMESLASEADGIDENDPRQAANVMRKLFDATGMPLGGSMQEALKRMESGEDPEKIEEDMGDVLGDFMGGDEGEGGGAYGGGYSRDGGLYDY
jgi:hypothetical protein